MNDVELAYIAGFFDGEGCICITKRKNKTSKSGYRISLNCSCSNVNPKPLYKCMQLFGGRVKMVFPSGGTRPAFCWAIWTRQAGAFLGAILPYLVVKKERAEKAIAFQKATTRGRLTKELSVFQEAQHILMSTLNK